jgi:hypothetical protein
MKPAILGHERVVAVTRPDSQKAVKFVINGFIKDKRDFAVVLSHTKPETNRTYTPVVIYRAAEPDDPIKMPNGMGISMINHLKEEDIVQSYKEGVLEKK